MSLKWQSLYHAKRHKERKRWPGYTYNTSSLTMDCQTRSFQIKTQGSCPNTSKTCVASWKSQRIQARRITPRRTDNQKGQIRPWKSSYESIVITDRTIGRVICQWHNSRSTRGLPRLLSTPHSKSSWVSFLKDIKCSANHELEGS